MWVRSKELKRPVEDRLGCLWHFQLWWGTAIQRLFFWDEAKETTGLLELPGDKALHYSRLRERIQKLAKDPDYRRRYLKPLKFPLERHYGE
jgi:hypothetical protein